MGYGLRSIDVGASRSGYDDQVKGAMAAMRRKAAMTQEEFAQALSEEIADGRRVRGHWISRWESGAYMPKGDIFLAAIAISGAQPPDLAVNPLSAKAIRMAELHREIRIERARREGKTRGPFLNRLDLERVDGDLKRYYTADQAAEVLRVARPTLYNLRERGEINAYRWGTRIVFLKAQVVALQSRRQNTTG